MTILIHEAVTSTTAIPSSFDPAWPRARTLPPSPAHEWSIADAARRNRISDGAAEIDRVRRLNWLQPELPAENKACIPVGADWSVFSPSPRTSAHPGSAPVVVDSSAFPPRIMDFTALAGGLYPDLCDALRDLEGVRNEAREEGIPVPSEMALGNARRLLHAVYRMFPRRFEVYPMPDGEIAIHVPGGPGRSILLLCGSDGGALCSVNMGGAHRRARYSDTRRLPDGFVRDALAELEGPASAAA